MNGKVTINISAKVRAALRDNAIGPYYTDPARARADGTYELDIAVQLYERLLEHGSDAESALRSLLNIGADS